jgi:hypothetical protein
VRLKTTIIDINKLETEINARCKYDKLKMRLCMIESKIKLSITVIVKARNFRHLYIYLESAY